MYNELVYVALRVAVNCVVFAYFLFSAFRSRFRYGVWQTALLMTLLIGITVAVTIFFLTAGFFLSAYSTAGVILWIVCAVVIFHAAIQGSHLEILFIVLMVLNLYVNIAAISRVLLVLLGLSPHNALAYTLLRIGTLVGFLPALWLLLEKLYQQVIEFHMDFSFWRFIWIIPALLYLVFFTKLLPDYWKSSVAPKSMDLVFTICLLYTSEAETVDRDA